MQINTSAGPEDGRSQVLISQDGSHILNYAIARFRNYPMLSC